MFFYSEFREQRLQFGVPAKRVRIFPWDFSPEFQRFIPGIAENFPGIQGIFPEFSLLFAEFSRGKFPHF
jgi:hypothetical protein